MAEGLRHPHGSYAVHGSVLDRRAGSTGTSGTEGVSGECTGDEKSAGTQERRARVAVADETAHTYGLLANSFRPPEEIRAVRTIWRQRDRLVQDAGRAIQQIQKALTTMNIRLANAISDVSGVTGLAIIRALLKGERDPRELAKLRHPCIQASEEEVVRSLEGHWRDDVLFELKQVVEGYDFYQRQMEACDEELQKYLAVLPDRRKESAAVGADPGPTKGTKQRHRSKAERKGKRRRKNQPGFDLQAELHRTFGVDLTRIDGIDGNARGSVESNDSRVIHSTTPFSP